jgi:hypothetical protein
MLQTTKGGSASLSAQYKIDSLQTLEAGYSYWNGSWPQSGGYLIDIPMPDQYQEYRQKTQQSGKFNFSEWVLNYQKKFNKEGQELQIIGRHLPLLMVLIILLNNTNLMANLLLRNRDPIIVRKRSGVFRLTIHTRLDRKARYR